MIRISFLFIFSFFLSFSFAQKEPVSVAFYNLENLFDTVDSPMSGDFGWTPGGGKAWDTERYQRKLNHLAYVIEKLDADDKQAGPDILGFCEVENRTVVKDLINTSPIDHAGYEIVHYDSPDHRGIDVGLLYRKDRFELIDSKTYTLTFPGEDYNTRDQLLVVGKLQGEKVHVIVNHWPSRRGGQEKSNYRRVEAAKLTKSIIDSVQNAEALANIIVMGDFNDDPDNESIADVLQATSDKSKVGDNGFFNPLANLLSKDCGTLCYRDDWFLFDQILLTKSLLDKDGLKYEKSNIYDDESIRVQGGKYDGHPLRTHAGTLYLKGYSDHFPVYVIFE